MSNKKRSVNVYQNLDQTYESKYNVSRHVAKNHEFYKVFGVKAKDIKNRMAISASKLDP